MSLKAFHILFITLSIILAVGFGVWGILSKNSQYFTLGVLSFVFAISLVVYEIVVAKKIKD